MPSSLPPRSVAVLIPAGGRGRRFAAPSDIAPQNKIFSIVAGKPVWFHAVERFAVRPDVGTIIVALSEHDKPAFIEQAAKFNLRGEVQITTGGEERVDSVRHALDCIRESNDDTNAPRYVAIHDAARPFVPHADLDAVFDAAAQHGAAMLGTPLTGSLKRARGGTVTNVDRRELFVALTPQVFKLDVIRNAYDRHRGFPVTDDAQLVERSGTVVTLVRGSAANIKLTHPEDLSIAEAILKNHVRQ